ncbi:IclR family transcriptional regulator [Clostridiaceae bacterium UIB06]|nr:IclR family transcriptional regulator [Clostridiaceae bacterium UIB06]
MSEESSNTRSIDRAFDILECFLSEGTELTLMDIANKLGLAPSTVHRIVGALEKRGYLGRNSENKKYHLGTVIAQLGNISLSSIKKDFSKIAFTYMVDLGNQFNESITLYAIDGKSRVCIERVESTRQLRHVLEIGERLPLGRGASGRVLLAYLPKEELHILLGEAYDEEFEKRLEKIRVDGYAVSKDERNEGLGAIAAPIFYCDGEVIASLSMSGPVERLLDEATTEKINEVIECASKISSALGYIKR